MKSYILSNRIFINNKTVISHSANDLQQENFRVYEIFPYAKLYMTLLMKQITLQEFHYCVKFAASTTTKLTMRAMKASRMTIR